MTLVSALIIMACFLMLGRFIIRLGVMEREAVFDHFNLPTREIPSQQMVGVKNPFLLKLNSDDQMNDGSTINTGDRLLIRKKNQNYLTIKLNKFTFPTARVQ